MALQRPIQPMLKRNMCTLGQTTRVDLAKTLDILGVQENIVLITHNGNLSYCTADIRQQCDTEQTFDLQLPLICISWKNFSLGE